MVSEGAKMIGGDIMPGDSLSSLEERVGRLVELTVRLKEEKKVWEKEKAILKSKVEEIAKQVEKVIGEEDEG